MSMSRLGWDNPVGRSAVTYPGLAGGRGDGYLIPVIPKSDFSFDARAGGATQDLPLAVGIDSSSWVSGVLVVRLHARNSWSGTTTLNVIVDNIQLVPEEPDVVFVSSAVTPVATTGATPINGLTTVPSLILVPFTTPIGSLLRVRLNYQCTAQQTGANTIALGVDLIGRPA